MPSFTLGMRARIRAGPDPKEPSMENELGRVPRAVVRVSERTVRKNRGAGTEDGDVAELAASIESQGPLNPPLLRAVGDGHFEVIAGQRRVHACRHLGWVE